MKTPPNSVQYLKINLLEKKKTLVITNNPFEVTKKIRDFILSLSLIYGEFNFPTLITSQTPRAVCAALSFPAKIRKEST